MFWNNYDDFFFIFLKFYFILIYNTLLVLPYINMYPPQMYTCSQSWTPFPPLSPYRSIANELIKGLLFIHTFYALSKELKLLKEKNNIYSTALEGGEGISPKMESEFRGTKQNLPLLLKCRIFTKSKPPEEKSVAHLPRSAVWREQATGDIRCMYSSSF